MTTTAQNPAEDTAREISLAVIQELAPEEHEIALGFLEPLIEMAEEGELPYIDPRDPGGGFGASDPLFVTVVPVVVEVLRELDGGTPPDQVWEHLGPTIDRIASEIGSQRALEERVQLEAAIRRLVGGLR